MTQTQYVAVSHILCENLSMIFSLLQKHFNIRLNYLSS